MKNILVIGANGKVGRLIVKNLVARRKRVRAMIRMKGQAEFLHSLGAETYLGDIEKDFSTAFENMDGLIFTAGSGSHTGPDKTIAIDQEGAKKSMDLAKKYGIKRYIMVSAQGARNLELPGKIQHYYKAKRIADDYLIQSGLNYTIFRPGRLLDERCRSTIEVSENINRKGTISRTNLALAISMAIDMTNTQNRIIEILDGEDDIIQALNSI
jgi:uncharacterized protein YbjT (DUF2867 family)